MLTLLTNSLSDLVSGSTGNFAYVAYATDDAGTGFSTSYDVTKKYQAILISDIEIPSLSASLFSGLWLPIPIGDFAFEGDLEAENLQVDSGDVSSSIHITTSTTGSTFNDGFVFNHQGTDGYIINRETGKLFFYTDDALAMTVAANGDVGFGTSRSSPAYNLDVEGEVRIGDTTRPVFESSYPLSVYPSISIGHVNTDITGLSGNHAALVIGEDTLNASTAGLLAIMSNTTTVGYSTGAFMFVNKSSESTSKRVGQIRMPLETVSPYITHNMQFQIIINEVITTALMIEGSTKYVGIGTESPTDILDINGNQIRIRTSNTPASASATGNTGEICWDSGYIYVCVATNTWKRAAISTW